MMFQSFATRWSLHRIALIAALIAFDQDLSNSGGAQAWSYNYSISPNRRWIEAKKWCQKYYTDMVMVRSQEENDHLNQLLIFHPKYYWIDVLKVGERWIWNASNVSVPQDVLNWAPGEPTDIAGQDCVEIYIKRPDDTAKWNNANCRNKKGTVCYTVSCREDSCGAHADCVETVGNYTCQCHPGFLGPRCEEAEQCPALNDTNIDAGRMNCSHPFAAYSYNSTCDVRCDEGYEPSGQERIRCDHTGQWTASVPACTIKRCAPIPFPPMGNMTCDHNLEPFAFGSWCNFTCQEGYSLTGDNALTCLASGLWSKPTPKCTVVQCNSLKDPPHAFMQCQDPLGNHSYGSICTVECEEGFDMTGANMTECSSLGNWSHVLPLCQVKRCNPINPPHCLLSCSDPHGSYSFGSRCTATCEEGFLLNGTASIECDSLGMWSADIPHCLAQRCPILNPPAHGSLNCSGPHGEFSFGSKCNSTCEEGFVLNGTSVTDCTAVGMWSADIPQCLAQRCPTLNSPPHGFFSCSAPHGEFSFGARCTSTCEAGFVLNGTADPECTSLGKWSTDFPSCMDKSCSTLNHPTHGTLACSGPHGEFKFGSRCTATCEEGFLLNGTASIECDSLGMWSADIPHCLAQRCPILNPPAHGSLNCSGPHGEFSFGSKCNSTCEEGFVLNGTSVTDCTAVGMWSADIPQCLAQRCPTLNSPPHGFFSCSAPHGEFSFGARCTSTCEAGFVLNGTADPECTSLGKWSTDFPSCMAKSCSTLNHPTHGTLACSGPHGEFKFGSRCTATCEEGFLLNGTASIECDSLGMWSADIPHCLAQRCPILNPPAHGSLNCSGPHGEFSFGSKCNSTCEEGFVLNGTSVTDCTAVGMWSADIPQCLAQRCPTLNSPPHGFFSCSAPHGEFSFGARCTSTCEAGFVLNGTADPECTSLGKWSTDFPSCMAKSCSTLNHPTHGTLACSGPHGEFKFGSRCTSGCKKGFFLNGTANSECTSLGAWSAEIPHCLAHPCPLLAKAPQHGRMNCSHPHSAFSFGSHCDFECMEGFWLRGTSSVSCNDSGHWDQDLPVCQPIQCEAIRAVSSRRSMNCSHPLGNFSFGSQCHFTCKEGFALSGTEMLSCSSSGFWSDSLPNCTVEGIPVGAALLMYTGVGAASVVVPLILIGLGLLILTQFKKRGNPIMSDTQYWEDRENPAFEF